MKKLFVVALLFLPVLASAQGLVHCGGQGQPPCTFCDFFVMFNNIVRFVLIQLIPPIAVLMVVIAGTMFLIGGGSTAMQSKGKSVLTNVVVGLVLIYGAWLITNTILMAVGVSSWTGLQDGWFKIECESPDSCGELGQNCCLPQERGYECRPNLECTWHRTGIATCEKIQAIKVDCGEIGQPCCDPSIEGYLCKDPLKCSFLPGVSGNVCNY